MSKHPETQFFYDLTPENMLNAIEKAYDIRCSGRVLALNSMENRVYEIEFENEAAQTPSEKFVIAKFYRPGRWSREQISEEHTFTRELQENEIPVVAPLLGRNGESIHQDSVTKLYFTLFPKAGGRTPDELNHDQLRLLGRLLARMHAVGQKKPAKHRLFLNPSTYGRQNLDYLRSEKKLPVEIAAAYESTVQQICDLCEPWFVQAKTQRIHGDCHFGNLIARGGEGFFLVDFDDMVMGPPVQDLWLLLPGDEQERKEKLDILLTAYESMFDFDRTSLRLIEPLRALRYIHFSTWIAKRWDDPAFPRAFPYFGTVKYWQDQLLDLREQLAKLYEISP